MDHVWKIIEELRERYETLREERTPIDVFAFFEIDLGLDPIPFDDLTTKYRVEAAITADFTGIYLDAGNTLAFGYPEHWISAHGFSCPPGGVHFRLSARHFPPLRRKANVKLRPNFTSKRGFLRAEKRAFLLRRALIISHKRNQEG